MIKLTQPQSPRKCNTKVQGKDRFGDKTNNYYPCEFKVKYKVRYKSGIRGHGFVEEELCKLHFNALRKNIERVKTRTGWNSELTFEEI